MCIEVLISKLIPNEPACVQSKYDNIFSSVSQEGIHEPVVVWGCDGELLLVHGHHRVMIYKDIGRTTVPAIIGNPSHPEMAKWTIKKRINDGCKGFEDFTFVDSVDERLILNENEKNEYHSDLMFEKLKELLD